MARGEHLKVRRMGSDVLGVALLGDRRQPEPEAFRVTFPGGDVEITRTTADDYWIHVRVNHRGAGLDPGAIEARIIDARLDLHGQHASDVDVGDFNSPALFHLALRVAALEAGKPA
jgi:hypothetical protein